LVENPTQKSIDGQALTLTDRMRVLFKGILDPIAAFLNRLGLMPNTMTLLGLCGNMIGALFLARGEIQIGGIIVLLMGPIDALDGTMARLRGMTGKFGAFVDSVTDRYSELVIFLGLLYFFAHQGNISAVILVFLSTAGSVMVSYVRARTQSLGRDTKVGVLTRMERYLVLAPSLILNYPIAGLWILAVLANITALQRIMDVRKQFHLHEPHHPKESGKL
jgi:CDP-diacylglycerol---glycerol-3-phosphate 3-phosphatidyltransferase